MIGIRLLAVFITALGVWGVTGCASSKEAESEDRSPRPYDDGAFASYSAPDLAPPAEGVRSIQLYGDERETSPPIMILGGPDGLTLEFDVMGRQGRPLSVYFYHANWAWRRDLSPVEYLGSFQQDDLLDYDFSTGTRIPYVHYAYRLPNDRIRFLVSGNYVLRVTEHRREEEVLFERAFFVAEQAMPLEFRIDRVLSSGSGYPSIQPLVRFQPPEGLPGGLFDFRVCFARNGRFELARCSNRPSLASTPLVQFYLEREFSFEPEEPPHFLDLTNLRSSNQIVSFDYTLTPYAVELEPDYARFSGGHVGPTLNGQPRISSVIPLGNPDTEAEYVVSRFAYVPPDERRVGNEVLITGSFNGWRYDPTYALSWVPERARYEGDVVMKQGQYEYRYVAEDLRLAHTLRSNLPQVGNRYTTFVYYDDTVLHTDRLLAVIDAFSP